MTGVDLTGNEYYEPTMSASVYAYLLIQLSKASDSDKVHQLFTKRTSLQVQSLWLALCLRLKHSFSGSTEVFHVHPHSPLAESQQTGFGANGFDIGTGEVVLLVDKLVEVNVLVERHLGGVESEDLLLG
jgi:hypothetical protein